MLNGSWSTMCAFFGLLLVLIKLSARFLPVTSPFMQPDLAFDKEHIWHPYSSMTEPANVWPVVSAE
ncbi:MAG: hypothetical protein ACPGGD_06815, partial [Thalassolituus sp.]